MTDNLHLRGLKLTWDDTAVEGMHVSILLGAVTVSVVGVGGHHGQCNVR